MSVRAKFKVTDKQPATSEPGGTVTLEAVTSGSAENDSFFNYTPSGTLRMGTINPGAFDEFRVGDEFYIDFTKAN